MFNNRPKNCLECKNDKTCHTCYASPECVKKWGKKTMKRNVIIAIVIIALVLGAGVIVSHAEEMEKTDAETIVLEENADFEDELIEEENTEELTEEDMEDEETEESEEDEFVEDVEGAEEVEETEERESEEDDFICEYMCEKDGFTYYFTYDYEVNPVDGICYIKMCEHCNYGATYESTKEEISEKFGYALK